MEKEKKMRYGLKKTKYMIVKTRKEKESTRKCKITSNMQNRNIPLLRNNNKQGRKPRRTYKGNSKKIGNNKQGNRCYSGKESSWKRRDKG